jgi:hypothetical protein
MNSTKLASRLVFMAKQLRGEADRHQGELRADLIRASRQLTYAFTGAYSKDPDRQAVTAALHDGAVDYLVNVISARTDRELSKGIPQ